MALLHVQTPRVAVGFLVSPVVAYKYGYFADEQIDKKIKSIKSDCRIEITRPGRPKRSVNQVSLGCHDPCLALPVPARNDPYSQLLGVCKRIVPELPVPSDLNAEMCCFIDAFFRLYFRPLRDDEIITPMQWLEGCSFPQSRKQQYIERWIESGHGKELRYDASGFEKEETYTDFKFPRNIQPLDLAINMLMGPIDKAIEKQVFALPCFIKKVPEHLRVDHLATQVCGIAQMVTWTDYTSMESQYEGVKFLWHERLERHFVRDLADGERYLELGRRTVYGWEVGGHIRKPKVIMPCVTAHEASNLRSGMTKTSRTNAVQNCVNRYFLLQKYFGINCLRTDVTYVTPEFDTMVEGAPAFAPLGIMEGDDGMFMEEKWAQLGTEHYASLGYICEPQHGIFGVDGDFLSVFYDPVDLEMLTDIRAVYADLGWGNSDYLVSSSYKKLQYLRAKAMSQWFRLPACPVVTAQALHVLRATAEVKMDEFFRRRHKSISQWELQQMYEAYMYIRYNGIATKKIGDRSRLMVEKYTGVTVDMQIEIERVFNESSELKPRSLMSPLVCPASWAVVAQEYVANATVHDVATKKDIPPPVVPRYDNFHREFWEKHGDQIVDSAGRSGPGLWL